MLNLVSNENRKIRYPFFPLLSWFLIHELCIVIDGLSDETGKSDILVVFGNADYGDIKGVHCNYYELRDAYSLWREFFAYYKYLIFK